MNKKVDEEYKDIKNVYIFQCRCSKQKDKIEKYQKALDKTKSEKKDLKEAKKFLWILEEFQKMDKEEQDYFLDYLKGKIDILGKTIKWEK